QSLTRLSTTPSQRWWKTSARAGGKNGGCNGRDILPFMSRVNLLGLLPSELEDLAVELGASRYRGRQLATWIYRKSVFDLEAMTDLPKDFRQELAERAVERDRKSTRLNSSHT